MEVNSSQECKVELEDLAAYLVPQAFSGLRCDVLLVADAPVDVFVSDYRFACYSLVRSRVVETPRTLSPAGA